MDVGQPARRGRPPRAEAEARHEKLLDTALDLFLEYGYELTTVEMIAARLGIAKRTVYGRYPDKAALFLTAVHRAIERQVLSREVLDDCDNGDLTDTLEAIARLRINQVMTPDGLRLHRIIDTDSYRFPEIFVAGYRLSTAPVIDFIIGLFDRAAAQGTIAPTDSDQAARAFLSMVVGSQVRAIVAGRPPTPAQIDERVRFTVHLLLDGLRAR